MIYDMICYRIDNDVMTYVMSELISYGNIKMQVTL